MRVAGEVDMCFTVKSIALDYEAISQNPRKVLEYVFKKSDSFSVVTDLVRPYS